MYFPSWPVFKALCKAVQYWNLLPTDEQTGAQRSDLPERWSCLDSEMVSWFPSQMFCPLDHNHWVALSGIFVFSWCSNSTGAIKCHRFKQDIIPVAVSPGADVDLFFSPCTCTCKCEWRYFHLTSSCNIIGIAWLLSHVKLKLAAAAASSQSTVQ